MATAPPADWSAQRKADYFDWAGEVVAGLRGSHPKLDALFDDAWRLKEFV
jgi:guanosine-3',5'-bis(diphosphate) 3'-pyrophosphohydrolase